MKVNLNDALYAAQTIYPKARKIKKINKGYSHEIFEIETGEYPEKVILKTNNNKIGKFSIDKEKRIHEIIQEKGIPCPRVIHLDISKKRVNFNFIIISKLEGIDLETVWERLKQNEKEKITEKMGEILGKIHQTKYEEIGYLTKEDIDNKHSFSLKKVGESPLINPFLINVVSDTMWDLGVLISNPLIKEEDSKKIFEYLLKNKKLSEENEKPSLIHGDFDIINLRVKKIKGVWQICGLLDFEYAASSSRAYEFLKLHRTGFFEDKEILNSLLKRYHKYQPEIKNFEEKVKFLRITRDIAFAGVLFKAGNIKKGKEVLDYILREIKN